MYGFFSLCVEHSVSYFKGFRHVITNVFHLWTTYEYGLRDPCRKELMKGKCRIFTVLSAQYGHYSWLHVWEYKKSRRAYLLYENIYLPWSIYSRGGGFTRIQIVKRTLISYGQICVHSRLWRHKLPYDEIWIISFQFVRNM